MELEDIMFKNSVCGTINQACKQIREHFHLIPKGRPMTPEERASIDEFFLSHSGQNVEPEFTRQKKSTCDVCGESSSHSVCYKCSDKVWKATKAQP